MSTSVFIGTGRRKTSVARVRVASGTGKFTINGKDIAEYCPTELLFKVAIGPLTTVDLAGKVDVNARVEGGGVTGQAGALAHGVARALLKMDPELRKDLKVAGHLTRDPRMKERKKSGQPGARKRFQFSKR